MKLLEVAKLIEARLSLETGENAICSALLPDLRAAIAEAEKATVPEDVQNSSFGCKNCLWRDCECRNGSDYIATDATFDGEPSCESYTFYD